MSVEEKSGFFVVVLFVFVLFIRADREFYNPAEANSVTVCALELDL